MSSDISVSCDIEFIYSAITQQLECSLCQGIYRDPRLLPCGHTFCLHCLDQQASICNRALDCALCRWPWGIPTGGIINLPKNYTLNAVITLITRTPNE